MRLLFVSNLFPSSVEPTRGTYNLNLMRGLRQLGHAVDVIAPYPWFPVLERRFRGRRSLPATETVDGFPVFHPRHFYTPGFWVHKHHLFYRRAVSSVLADRLAQGRMDACILGFAYPDACAMARTCRLLKLPYIVRVNGSDFRVRMGQKKFADLVRRTLSEAPAIVCPGETLSYDISLAIEPGNRIRSFKNGVDHTLFTSKTGTRRKRILFVGNLVPIKGPDRALEAFLSVAEDDRGAHMDIVGSGSLSGFLKRRVRASGSADRIVFHGQQPPDQVALLMRRSACLCLSSHSEGMPNVVLESLACGTPVVATSVGEVPLLVRDGVDGFIVNSGPDESQVIADMAGALRKAMDFPWNHDRISRSVEGFTWRAAAEVVVEAVEDAVAEFSSEEY